MSGLKVIEFAILGLFEDTPGMTLPMIKRHLPDAMSWDIDTLQACGFVARRKDDSSIIEITTEGREEFAKEKTILAEHPAIAELRKLNLDELSPMARLTKLYELKRMVK